MSCKKRHSKRGFGHGPFGGANVLPWGGSVPETLINKGLQVLAYKAALDVTKPVTPVGYKAKRVY